MRTIRIKNQNLVLIKNGLKTLEVRVGYPGILKIRAGEQLKLCSKEQELIVEVRDVRTYANFDHMRAAEEGTQIAPDIETQEQLLKLIRDIYPPAKERLGVVVLEIKETEDRNR